MRFPMPDGKCSSQDDKRYNHHLHYTAFHLVMKTKKDFYILPTGSLRRHCQPCIVGGKENGAQCHQQSVRVSFWSKWNIQRTQILKEKKRPFFTDYSYRLELLQKKLKDPFWSACKEFKRKVIVVSIQSK